MKEVKLIEPKHKLFVILDLVEELNVEIVFEQSVALLPQVVL
jgi:hypothetical protein